MQHGTELAEFLLMTMPRYVPEGRVWFLCRRCTQRQFLLKPSKQANQAFLYCLAVAAKKTGVQVLWTVAMSNHHHTGIYDPKNNIVAFTREFHRLLAKHHNAMLGRWENFWAAESPTNILLHDAHDILSKLVYSLANPASAHLVEHAHHWPGAISLPHQLGTSTTVKRPKNYFRDDGSMPASVELEFHLPPGFEEHSASEFQSLVASKLAEREDELVLRRQQQSRKVLGRRNILRQSPQHSPQSMAPRRKLQPKIAAQNRWRRLEAIARLRQFVNHYQEALKAWREGVRDVLFPPGTYAMRMIHGARCGPSEG